jgi:hypothetical protein
MWNHKYNLVARTGSYVGKDQTTKFTWETVGKELQDETGRRMIMIKRSFNPAGVLQEPGKNGQISDHIILTMSEVKTNEHEDEVIREDKPRREVKSLPNDELPF